MRKEYYSLDVRKVYQYFGGARAVHDIFLLRGHELSMKAVEKWRERHNIPSWALLELVGYSLEEGHELKLSEFMQPMERERVRRLEDNYVPDEAADML